MAFKRRSLDDKYPRRNAVSPGSRTFHQPPSTANSLGPRTFHQRIPTRPYEPGECAWYAHTDEQAAYFTGTHPGLEPFFPELVIGVCADLAWSLRSGEPSWQRFDIAALWGRLEEQERVLPQPRVVLSMYITLCDFLPFLVREGELTPERAREMREVLERVKSPLVEASLARLRGAERSHFAAAAQPPS